VQFPSAVQEVGRHAVPLLMQLTPPGHAEVVDDPGTQAPLPSQAAGVTVSWLPLHAEVPGQDVAAGVKAHLPLPSQEPVVPQGVVPTEQSLSALLPAGSGLQAPSVLPVFAPTHDWQVPAQSLSQQT